MDAPRTVVGTHTASPDAEIPVLSVEEVGKRFGRSTWANRDITLDIYPGEVFGLLGPNGAGKSTLVKQILGLLRPTEGRVLIGGVDIARDPHRARQWCSFQPQAQPDLMSSSIVEAISIVGRIRGGSKQVVADRVDHLLRALQIGEWEKVQSSEQAGGVARLVSFCLAIVVPGRLVLLDEPTNDVDPLRRRLLWQEVRAIADQGAAVLLVTHNVLEAERVVDRLAIMKEGRVVAMGAPKDLKSPVAGRLRLEIVAGPSAPEFPFGTLTRRGSRHVAEISSADVAAVAQWAQDTVDAQLIEQFSIQPTDLEDIYTSVITATGDDEAEES
jgi:ABC-2 type transport system ATP-binding protein